MINDHLNIANISLYYIILYYISSSFFFFFFMLLYYSGLREMVKGKIPLPSYVDVKYQFNELK